MAAVPYPTDDTQLAGLIQAATAAAGQEREWQITEEATSGVNTENGTHAPSNAGANDDVGVIYAQEISASQIDPSIRGQQGGIEMGLPRRSSTRKRKRGQTSIPTIENVQEKESTPQGEDGTPPVDLADARAAGVHSATALFRQPSASSKKYTRPPMSKMFTSLEISPENFLHLQAAAKNYMLDPDYPDRRDCVGQRGRGDTDMVKLKLWNCVKDFLGKERNGERFFGEETFNEGMPGNRYIWPRDEAKIIKLSMPLLRRMVTNERQRQYANETRKGGGDKRRSRNEEPHDDGIPAQRHPLDQFSSLLDQSVPDLDVCDGIYGRLCSLHDLERFYEESYLMPDDFKSLIIGMYGHFHFFHNDDPSQCLDDCAFSVFSRIFAWEGFSQFNSKQRDTSSSAIRELFGVIKASFGDIEPLPEDQQHQPSSTAASQALPITLSQNPPTEGQFPLSSPFTLQINILREQKRILPRLDINVQTCPTFSEMKKFISEHYADALGERERASMDIVKVWVPDGLVTIETEDKWETTFWSATRVDWMDGVLKVLVEMPAADTGEID